MSDISLFSLARRPARFAAIERQMCATGLLMTNFTPGPEHAGAFRTALGKFATGVTIVTAPSDHGPLAMTANSFTSVSLDPPLILWCPAKISARHDGFISAAHFSVHILANEQHDVAMRCARPSNIGDDLDLSEGPHGAPIISDCLVRFDCATERCLDGGDHTIVLGRVLHVTQGDGAPLIFHDGKLGKTLT